MNTLTRCKYISEQSKNFLGLEILYEIPHRSDKRLKSSGLSWNIIPLKPSLEAGKVLPFFAGSV